MGQIGVLKLAANICHPGLQATCFMAKWCFYRVNFVKTSKTTQLGWLQRAVIHNPMAEKCSNSVFAIQNTPKSG